MGEPTTRYGQVNTFLALTLPTIFPFSHRLRATEPTTLILAAVAVINPDWKSKLGICYTKLGGIEVVDASFIRCVVGRVWDRKRWVIVERNDAMRNVIEDSNEDV